MGSAILLHGAPVTQVTMLCHIDTPDDTYSDSDVRDAVVETGVAAHVHCAALYGNNTLYTAVTTINSE